MRTSIPIFNYKLQKVFLLELDDYPHGGFINLNKLIFLTVYIDITIFSDDFFRNIFDEINESSTIKCCLELRLAMLIFNIILKLLNQFEDEKVDVLLLLLAADFSINKQQLKIKIVNAITQPLVFILYGLLLEK
jgi:hypothetical protein